jgi:hypothetical protein
MGTFYSSASQVNTDNNYSFDSEGRLVRDRQEEIDTIIWTVSGKVKEIIRTPNSEKPNLRMEYDAFGRRVAKYVYNNQTDLLEKATFYLLDPQGNQISIYEYTIDSNTTKYNLTDRNIFGSSRLGTLKEKVDMFNPQNLPSYGVLGNRNFEISNHLGNVQTVINDHVFPLSSDGATIDGYQVGIESVYDYSPFGVLLDGRTIEKQQVIGLDCYNEIITDTTYLVQFPTSSTWETSGCDGVPQNILVTDTLKLIACPAEMDFAGNSYPSNRAYSITLNLEAGKTYYTFFDYNLGTCANAGYTVDFYHFGNWYPLLMLGINGVFPDVPFTAPSSGEYTLKFTMGSTNQTICEAIIRNLRVYSIGADTVKHCEPVYGGGFRYSFSGHERIDEVHNQKSDVVDMGDRWLDNRLGRTHKMDVKAGSYPGISPYAYALNSPLLFNDTDGKDARVTVQKDEKGGGKITIVTTVYIIGKNANEFNAGKYTDKAAKFYKSGTYTDEKGNKFDIEFDVKFEFASDKSKIKLQDGDNILEYKEENVRSHINTPAYEYDDDGSGNISNVKRFTGNEGIIGRQDAIGISFDATLHETLHFLGLSDRYEDVGEKTSESDEGFENDRMGSAWGDELNQVHYDNIGKAYSGKESGEYILKETVDTKSSDGSLIGGSSDGKRPIPEAK